MTLACSKCESYWSAYGVLYTAQEMKFSTKDFFSKCDQMPSFQRIWSHLLKKSLIENFSFCAEYKNVVKALEHSLIYPDYYFVSAIRCIRWVSIFW